MLRELNLVRSIHNLNSNLFAVLDIWMCIWRPFRWTHPVYVRIFARQDPEKIHRNAEHRENLHDSRGRFICSPVKFSGRIHPTTTGPGSYPRWKMGISGGNVWGNPRACAWGKISPFPHEPSGFAATAFARWSAVAAASLSAVHSTTSNEVFCYFKIKNDFLVL